MKGLYPIFLSFLLADINILRMLNLSNFDSSFLLFSDPELFYFFSKLPTYIASCTHYPKPSHNFSFLSTFSPALTIPSSRWKGVNI